MEKSKYIKHISGLKGMACVFIMLFHYLEIYKTSVDFFPRINFLDKLLNSSFGFLFNQTYWLYLFFIISGYLISKSSITSFKEFIVKSVSRFFRFFFPVFFADFVIFLLVKIFSFSNYDTITLFTCPFLQTYPYGTSLSFINLLKSPVAVFFQNGNFFNPPFWVIKPMFIASVVIYFFKFLLTKTFDKYENFLIVVLTLVLCLLFKFNTAIAAVLLGMCLEVYGNNIKEYLSKPCFNICFLVLVMLMYIVKSEILGCLFFMALVILIPMIPALNKLFSSKFFLYLEKMSWGIYSFHMIIFCTIGCKILLLSVKSMNLLLAFICASIASVLITVILSQIYFISFEKAASFINAKISGFMKKHFLKK